jgi:hypothetical protein
LLSGFKTVPGRSTFSRNFTALSGAALMSETPDTPVKDAHRGRTVYHVPGDSAATGAREKAEKKPAKRGENAAGKRIREPAEASLKNIDTACARGRKKNSHGNTRYWTGYKLRPDVSDTGFPLSAFVSGANAHGSRLAIPLEKMTEKKVFFVTALWMQLMIRLSPPVLPKAANVFR